MPLKFIEEQQGAFNYSQKEDAFVNSPAVTKQESCDLQVQTEKQRDSSEWFEARKNRTRSSTARVMFSRKKGFEKGPKTGLHLL